MTEEVERYQSRSYTRSLWLGLVTGPVVWITYFVVVYLLAEVACRAGLLQEIVLGLPLLASITVALTLVSLGLMIYAGIWDYRHWRRIDRERERIGPAPSSTDLELLAAEEQIQPWQRSRFMAFSGMLLNLLFGLTTILTAIPALVLAPCG